MFELPRSPRFADLRGFWLSFSLVSGTLAAAILRTAQVSLWAVSGVAVAGALTIIGWRAPTLMRRAYSTWNRSARRVGKLVRSWVTVTVYAILAVAGRFGARLPLSVPPGVVTGWRDKRTLSADAFGGQSSLQASGARQSWIADLATWGWGSGNGWVLALIPFLTVLSTVEAASARPVTGKNYTLY